MLVFWSKGFESASMTDLTDATGIRSASLYAAFYSALQAGMSILARDGADRPRR